MSGLVLSGKAFHEERKLSYVEQSVKEAGKLLEVEKLACTMGKRAADRRSRLCRGEIKDCPTPGGRESSASSTPDAGFHPCLLSQPTARLFSLALIRDL
jgi:hypothetical protein